MCVKGRISRGRHGDLQFQGRFEILGEERCGGTRPGDDPGQGAGPVSQIEHIAELGPQRQCRLLQVVVKVTGELLGVAGTEGVQHARRHRGVCATVASVRYAVALKAYGTRREPK